MNGMRSALRWTWAVAVVLALAGATPDAGMDPRLAEAQRITDEAKTLLDAGKYAEAVPKVEQAISLREAVLGPSHPEVAGSLGNLASLYLKMGKLDEAEPLLDRALRIQEAARGKDHPEVATVLHNLGVLAFYRGQYSRAVALYQRALDIREKALGPSHPLTTATMNNLAVAYAIQGQYELAEPLYERVLATREQTLDKNHPNLAVVLNNLANVYDEEGLHDRAEPLYQRALAIYETSLGKDHPDVAGALHNLAEVAIERGQYDRAESLGQRALGIREAALGKEHPLVAASLDDLARLNAERGHFAEAESLHRRALAIREATLGKEHTDTATSLLGLARSLAEQGRFDQAEPLYQRGLGLREATLGSAHPFVADSLNRIAELRLRQRRLSEAVPLLARSLAISEGRLRREALSFSGARLASFLQFLGTDEQRVYSLARAHPADPDVRRLALTATLLFKGRSIEEASATARTVLARMGGADRDAFDRLRDLRTQLTRLSLDGPGDEPPAEYQKELKELADQGDAVEADLAKRSAPLRARAALPAPAEIVDRVASAIPKDAALVDLISYSDSPVPPKPGTPESKVPVQARYLALVLFPNGHSAAADLGPVAPVDSAVARLNDALASQDAAFQGAARKLYQLAFKPLLPLLGSVHKLFVAADGQLAVVPFAALHDGRRFLADAFDITYLTSGRDLLPRPGTAAPSSPMVVLADPDYRAGALAQVSAPERSAPLARFFAEGRGLSDQRWPPLPGTRAEAEAIHALLPQAQIFVGAEASKARLLGVASPAILHVASHGFFLEDAPSAPGGRGLGEVGAPAARLEDPLLRSGLVLAGASAQAGLGNSLATALELAGLDLWGTELVVLSACDTGRGEVHRGQGVYGLRRALVVAGAETVVVSLWKVDDETTRTMMERYYRNLLAGQGRAEALKGAMLALRATHPHPHFWAPFIAIGRDAPLRALTAATRAE